MTFKNKTFKDIVLAVFIGFCILCFFFKKPLFSPSDYIFSKSGDGVKNYYTFAYFAENDRDFHFSGMNYPYGEFSLYTDNHPILAEFVSFIHRHVVDLSDHTTGIINILSLLSFLLTIWIFVLIFKEFNIQGIWAIIGSVLITFLTPQTIRLISHYSLSYSFMFPLVWLLLIRISKQRRVLLNTLILSVFLLFASMIHTYHLFMSLCFMSAYILVLVIRKRRFKAPSPQILLALMFSGLSFFLFTNIYDAIDDRPQSPFGLSSYTITTGGTFLPYNSSLSRFISETTGQEHTKPESHGYIGMASIIILLTIIFQLIRSLLRKRERKPKVTSDILNYVFAAVIVWIFGTNFLNEITNNLLYDILPPLKQFRSLGRISWVFYYVITFYCIYWMHTYWKSSNKKTIPVISVSLLLLFWMIDIYFSVFSVSSRINKGNDLFACYNNPLAILADKHNIQSQDYQAILTLPYYHVGSEKIQMERGKHSMSFAFGLSYCTGLPLINSMMSRSSISQSLSQLQLIKNQNIIKERLVDMDDRDILLLKGTEELLSYEQELINKGKLIASQNKFALYSLPVSAFMNSGMADTTRNSTTDIELDAKPASVSNSTDSNLEYHHFDTDKSTIFLAGGGSKSSAKNENTPFLSHVIEAPNPDAKINLSFWMYVDPEIQGMPLIDYKIIEKNKTIFEYRLKYFRDPLTFGKWIYFTFDLERGKNNRTFEWYSNTSMTIDELLIRSTDNDVWYQDPMSGLLFKNNLPVDQFPE